MNTETQDKINLIKPHRIKGILNLALILAIIFGSAWFAGFNVIEVIINIYRGASLLDRMFLPPDFSYTPRIMGPLLETIQMAIVGTFIGAIIAIPVSLFAADNFIKNKWLNIPTRFILNIFRTIPALVLASLFVSIFGVGNFPGILALAIFTFGLISKLTYESIEAIDYGQVEAMISVGGTKMTILRYSIIPQVLPQYLSYTLYAFEVNVRAAAVLGYVGAGGIGQIYEYNLAWLRYSRVGMIIIISFLMVLIIDLISSSIRRRLV
ncbi:MAG: phosphonate ABC transporter, permease protein PhnE [Bacilli bacterium]|nr:phosphonate ABC transporter, permease protein PhnE [Bacilli bacterium]MBN2695956.1 phosphonate ABC transporter, permease protein PhnE [Bacilli bacterium]